MFLRLLGMGPALLVIASERVQSIYCTRSVICILLVLLVLKSSDFEFFCQAAAEGFVARYHLDEYAVEHYQFEYEVEPWHLAENRYEECD